MLLSVVTSTMFMFKSSVVKRKLCVAIYLSYICFAEPPKLPDRSVDKNAEEETPPSTSGAGNGHDFEENKYKEIIFGEDALKIPPSESYCLNRPVRRGHFNVSHNYSLHQVGNQINVCFFSH